IIFVLHNLERGLKGKSSICQLSKITFSKFTCRNVNIPIYKEMVRPDRIPFDLGRVQDIAQATLAHLVGLAVRKRRGTKHFSVLNVTKTVKA
ncbi:hypothetical protein BpHYR1_011852, partial [Brachionus plicatilis]